jgi:hypothetical protein
MKYPWDDRRIVLPAADKPGDAGRTPKHHQVTPFMDCVCRLLDGHSLFEPVPLSFVSDPRPLLYITSLTIFTSEAPP